MCHLGFYMGSTELNEIYRLSIGINPVFVTLYSPVIDGKPPELFLRS